MLCTQCGTWELAKGDLVCSLCGARYLRFTVSLDPAQLSAADYPPPVELRVSNESPLGSLTLEHIQPDQGWVTVLPDPPLPSVIRSGEHHSLFLDVDTFSAPSPAQGSINVRVRYAPEAQTAVLRLHQPEPAGT